MHDFNTNADIIPPNTDRIIATHISGYSSRRASCQSSADFEYLRLRETHLMHMRITIQPPFTKIVYLVSVYTCSRSNDIPKLVKVKVHWRLSMYTFHLFMKMQQHGMASASRLRFVISITYKNTALYSRFDKHQSKVHILVVVNLVRWHLAQRTRFSRILNRMNGPKLEKDVHWEKHLRKNT